MRTKHLFYTMALASAFAACTNEEFIGDAPQGNSVADRPTVANVKLEMGESNTRLVFDGGKFTWEKGDKIAAMLMDQNNTGVRYGSATLTEEWNKLTWLERYHLVDYVHTNYPFTYNGSEWSTDANMLEGNYFLVYPYKSFVGQRQAYFDISNQKQVGNTNESRKKAYAANQHFIGYARLDATAGDSKLKARMSEVLAPVRINIQSNCTEVANEKLEVHKIVLAHPTFYSQYSVDPTTAQYGEKGKWNLVAYDRNKQELETDQNPEVNETDLTKNFNYANYLVATGVRPDAKYDPYLNSFDGSADLKDYVYNIAEGKIGLTTDKWSEKPENNKRAADKYYYDEAIRATVKPLWKENWSENTTKYVEVYTYADEEGDPMILKSGEAGMLGIVAMVPPFNNWNQENAEGLQLYIYTNKGLVGPVDLSVKHTGAGSDVQTTDAIVAADPKMPMQTVTVILDDPDIVRVPDKKLINNTNDLKEYVAYLTKNPTNSRIDITLTNDVTIDDELAKAIKSMWSDKGVDNVSLYISTSGLASKNANVKIATQTETDILEYLDIDGSLNNGNGTAATLVEVVSGATVDLTWKAHNFKSAASEKTASDLYILVDNGGKLNITDAKENGSSVGGWTDVTNFDKLNKNVFIENNGSVNVNSAVKNSAGIVLTNESGTFTVKEGATITLAPKSENKLTGYIVVEENARLSGSINSNLVNYGTINNSGALYSVENKDAEKNPKQVRPGRVWISSVDAKTSLSVNEGIVEYIKLPTVPVEVIDGDYTKGVFAYEAENIRSFVSELTKHHVTDMVVNGGSLASDQAGKSTLRYLTLKGNAVVNRGGMVPSENIVFADKLTGGNAFNVSWNNDYAKLNQVKTSGTPTIDNVNLVLGNVENTRHQFIFNGSTLTLKGQVKFRAASNVKADICLNGVEMTVEGKASAGVLYTMKDGKTSEVVVAIGGELERDRIEESTITINK